MANLVNSIKSTALSVAERLAPVLKESKFRETGVLTPEEFVLAGEHLVHHCPTWQWSPGDPAKAKDYLPKDKQFLITKNVPCYRRCVAMEYDAGQERIVGGGEGSDIADEWVDTHHFAKEGDASTVMAEHAQSMEGSRTAVSGEDDDDDGPALDMEEVDNMMDNLDVEDPDPHVATPAKEDSSNVLATRTYDLNITYDKYYQVPRMWLTGYNEKREPLSVEEMYADFSADHARKTITMETHPHIPGPPAASIHPCKHAEVMKRLMDQLADSGRSLSVELYLLVFLKFVQAVIPTIEYDYTRNVNLS